MSFLADMLRAEFGASFEDVHATLPTHPTKTYTRRAVTDIKFIVLHHTEAPSATGWQAVAHYHVNGNDWPGIGYAIGLRDYGGRCMVSLLNEPETRSYHAHAVGNNSGIAVCVAGKFDDRAPTAPELDALTRTVAVLRRWATWHPWMVVNGHGDVPGNETECPGKYLKEVIPVLNAPAIVNDADMRQRIWDAAKFAQSVSPNPGSAIEVLMREQGYTPIGQEVDVLDASGAWAGVTQLGYYPGGNANGVAFYATNKTPTGAWEAHMVERPGDDI